MTNYKTYFSSLDVFNKVSDINTKDILRAIDSQILYEPLSSNKIDSFLEDSKALTKEEISGSYELMLNTMLVNGQLANKSISLSEQMHITSSNFTTNILNPVLSKTKLATTKNISKSTAILDKPIFDYTTVKEIIKNTNIEIVKLDSQSEIDEYISSSESIDRTELLTTKIGILDDSSDAGRDFINDAINNTDRYLSNYIIYQSGISRTVTLPKYLNHQTVSNVTKAYLNKIGKFKDSKTKKHIFGDAGAIYDNGQFTAVDSYFKKQLNSTSIKNKALEVSNIGSANQMNKARLRNNPFIDDMLKAGPNIYSNMFDIYFRFNSEPSHNSLIGINKDQSNSATNIVSSKSNNSQSSSNAVGSVIAEETVPTVSYLYFIPITNCTGSVGSKTINNSLTQVEDSTFNDVFSLSVRTANVTIPLKNRESKALKYLNTEVERPNSIVNQNLEGTISIDCDANAYVNDMFLALAGLQRDGQIRDSNGQLVYINDGLHERAQNHYPFMAPAKLGYQMSTVDIVVSSHSLSMWSDKSINPTYGGYYSNILFIFKDVRFLGVASGLQFNTENSGSQTCEVKFIAKDLETYFKPDNMDYAMYNTNIVRSSLFAAKNRYGEYYDEDSITERKERTRNDLGMAESS